MLYLSITKRKPTFDIMHVNSHSNLAAIQQQMAALDQVAARISDPGYAADVSAIAELQQAELAVKVNAAVISQQHQLAQHIIDILA